VRITLSFLILISSFQFSFGQKDSVKPDDQVDTTYGPGTDMKRLKLVIGGEVVATAGTMLALSQVWYKDFKRTSFHTFDDNGEWMQMDKFGHAVTSYYIGKAGIGMLKWCGVKEWKAAVFGGTLGLVYQSGLELLDGYSSGWGFSWGDMAANAAGTVLCTSQELLWHQQRITLKFSYNQTIYPSYRPDLLGKTDVERVFKDYNGQTYWLSANIASFIKRENKFPKWLDVSFGYGAGGMTGGSFNPDFNEAGQHLPYFIRYRTYYFSLDADLWRIKTKNKFLKNIFNAFGFIKLPFPALQWTPWGLYFQPIYF